MLGRIGLFWILIGYGGFVSSVDAQTWDNGGVGSNWSTADNWDSNQVPSNDGTADVSFGGFFSGSSSTIDQQWNINSLTIGGVFNANDFAGQALTIQSSVVNNGLISGGTFNNAVVLPNQTVWSSGGAAAITINGEISGAGGITKQGGGSLTLSGGNTYTGNTNVSAGTLLFSAPDVLADTSSLTLSGGTLNTQGFSDTISSLTVDGDSTIDLGSGVTTLAFGGSVYSGGVLTISGYTPGEDVISFASAPDQSFLDQVFWSDQGILGSSFSGGQIVPIPEPSAVLGGAMILFAGLASRFRSQGRNRWRED